MWSSYKLMIVIVISWTCTNVSIVSDALKYVERKKEQLDTIQKADERI
jgi:hypothetical protein